MEALQIGTRREVCWDEMLMDRAEGVRVQMHKPVYRDTVFEGDAPWEGLCCGYFVIVPDEGQYRLYYRGATECELDAEGKPQDAHKATFCYAESKDGKHFERVNVGLHSFWGSKENNILLDNIRDNMFFFKDTNPDCPPDARYKGLAEHDVGRGKNQTLCWFKSADGIHFEMQGVLTDDGAFDSLNVCFWDDLTKQYWLFFRGLHGAGSKDGKWLKGGDMHTKPTRDIRVKTSRDFVHWTDQQMLQYEEGQPDLELYTNMIQPYYRARHMMIGFPMRYMDRYEEAHNFRHLPDWKHRKQLIRYWGRGGTAITDGAIMTSRDGLHFKRWDEAFWTAGIRGGDYWYYGDGLAAYGMVETASDIPARPMRSRSITARDIASIP